MPRLRRESARVKKVAVTVTFTVENLLRSAVQDPTTTGHHPPGPAYIARRLPLLASSVGYTEKDAQVCDKSHLSELLVPTTVMIWTADVVRVACPRSSESVTTNTSDVPSKLGDAAPVLRFDTCKQIAGRRAQGRYIHHKRFCIVVRTGTNLERSCNKREKGLC